MSRYSPDQALNISQVLKAHQERLAAIPGLKQAASRLATTTPADRRHQEQVLGSLIIEETFLPGRIQEARALLDTIEADLRSSPD